MSSAVLGLIRGRVLVIVLAAIAAGLVVTAAVGTRSEGPPGPAKDAISDELWLPGTAHVAGAAGTDWRSDVEVFNPGPDQAQYRIELLEHGQANPDPQTVSFALGAGRAVRYGDLLDEVFGFSGSAALHLAVTTGSVLVTCRTYNRTEDGTYGQYIAALDPTQALGQLEEGRLIQLTHNRTQGTGFRTNLGYLNLTADPLRVTVDYRLANGTSLGTRQVDLAPFEFRQHNRAFEQVTGQDVADGFAVVRADQAGARFLAYASVVDNRTGDPIYLPAQVARPAGGKAMATLYVVASANVAGAGSTQWRTDLELHNPGARAAAVDIALLETDADNSDPRVVTHTVAGGACRRLEDVLATEFGFVGTAALRVTSSSVLVTSRTYNLTADGTFGQFIGAVSEDDALVSGDQAALVQLSHQSGGGGARTNLGFVNTTTSPTTVRLDAFQADGTALGSLSWTLPPLGHVQVNRVLGRLTTESIADAYGVVSTSDAAGRFLAYASVVDNDTGDPILVPAVRLPGGLPPTATPTVTPTPTAGPAEPAPAEPVNVAGYLADWLATVPGVGDFPNLDEAVADWQTNGFGSLLAEVAAADPGVVTASGTRITADYGNGTTLADGTVVAGMMAIEFSNLSASPSRVELDVATTATSLAIDGRSLDLDTAQGSLTADVDGDGHVAGSLSFSGSSAKRSDTITGNVLFDTAICQRFPTGGTISVSVAGETHTFTIPNTCNGGYDYDGWDFTYSYDDPTGAAAQTYIAHLSNIEQHTEGSVSMWIPSVGGSELATTTPGVITYRFGFDREVAAAWLRTNNPTFHWSYSRGHNFVSASRDGVTWVQLLEVEPPEYGAARSGWYVDLLPDAVLGGHELWVRVELYSYGDRAEDGPPWTNTAQHSRWTIGNTGAETFTFKARLRRD